MSKENVPAARVPIEHVLGSALGKAPAPAILPPESQSSTPIKDIPTEIKGKDLILTLGARSYRVRGWQKPLSPETLKVNLMVSRDSRFHVDSLDLYHAKARTAFIRQASVELGTGEEVLKLELGKVLREVEGIQAELLEDALRKKNAHPEMTAGEEVEARDLLTSPDLIQRIRDDFRVLGVVGESSNMLTGYLAAVSRLLDRPLALLIQSASAAGKTSLMDAVLDLFPPESQVRYSAMSGQSVFYLGERSLSHKVLCIAEEEGAKQASYALKLLQSEGAVTMASTSRDPNTGMLVTHDYVVHGPVMLFMTTTSLVIDEELQNRCVVLGIDESREQTRAIHAQQRHRETLEGLLARQDRERVLTLHRNAQRLLQPLAVVNPYADQLGFRDDQTRSRRDHTKYLALIRSITLLHQFQREVRTYTHQGQEHSFIEVQPSDIALANELASEVLGRSMDELLPQTRKLLGLLYEWISGECRCLGVSQNDFRFSRRQIREALAWGDTQLKVHLARLVELELILAHRGKQGRAYTYELLYQGEDADGRAKLLGLIDCSQLTPAPKGAQFTGAGLGVVGHRSGAGQGRLDGRKANQDKALQPLEDLGAKTASRPSQKRSRQPRTEEVG
jgi:DNA primase